MSTRFFTLTRICLLSLLWAVLTSTALAQDGALINGQPWPDTNGRHINAHGGCILQHGDTYYWYGEQRPDRGFTMDGGITVYKSTDLRHWTDCGICLHTSSDEGSDIERGCIMERPKVLWNERTRRFVMLFHLELKGRGYEAARVAFAESESPTGPFRFVRSKRLHAKTWPFNMSDADILAAKQTNATQWNEWWTPEWRKEVEKGMYLWRDMESGQMSRDMTVFTDTDGTAYHITSSQENLTLLISELSADYLDFTGKYIMLAPGGLNEAPCLFRHADDYWLICSGCTGWAPNEARMFKAKSIWGPWTQLPSPFQGTASGYRDMPADKTFGAQGTFVCQLEGRFVFMADVWNPRHLARSLHFWLPVHFDNDGTPFIPWADNWKQ